MLFSREVAASCWKLLQQERLRLWRRGKQYLLALLLNIVLFCLYRAAAVRYWPAWILNNHEHLWHIYYFGTLAIMLATHLSSFLFFGLIDYFGWFPEHKVVKDNLPWDVDPEGWRRLRNRAIYYNFLVVFLIGPGLLLLDSLVTRVSFSVEVPSLAEMLLQLYFLMNLESVLFFLFHKLSHVYWYEYHKLHHEFTVATPLATSHTHPIDYIGTAVPFAIGVIILGERLHYLTFVLWSVWRIAEGYDGHSNYDLPWSPFRVVPFSSGGQYHSFHHSHNTGNYGSITFIPDTLSGNNSDYDGHLITQLDRKKTM